MLERTGVCRGLAVGTPTPSWAVYGRKTWVEAGHRLIVLMFDSDGQIRSVRGIRIELTADADLPTDTTFNEARTAQAERIEPPKRLPPKGHRADGLVMANRSAIRMLRRQVRPRTVIICEGEPDFLTRCSLNDEDVVLGIVSGSWGHDSAFAAAIPSGSDVHVLTHNDNAGDRYAADVSASIGSRCKVWRATNGSK